jgi:O-antigen/teichoic acid export membrane protein
VPLALLGKVAASIADQGVASSTNFVLNVLLARWLAPREYGAYSVCWAILLILAGFHNALILEPLTVVGPAEYRENLPAYLIAARRLNWPVVFALALIALFIGLIYQQQTVRAALFVMAACLPGYLLLLMARRKQYVLNQPIRAFYLSALYAVLVFAFLSVCRITGKLSAITAVASFGLAWVVGSTFHNRTTAVPVPLNRVAREHWHYGKWLFASALLAMGVSDMQTVLLSMLVDLKSAGALRALMNFVLPLFQLLTVLSVYALPRLSGRAKEWGVQRLLKWGIQFPIAMVALCTLYLGLLTLFAPQLEHLLYGGKMESYVRWVPLLAASAFVSGIGASFSTLLRAVQNSKHQFFAGVAGSTAGLISALLLLRKIGIAGALWSMLAANLCSTLIIAGFYVMLLRRKHA